MWKKRSNRSCRRCIYVGRMLKTLRYIPNDKSNRNDSNKKTGKHQRWLKWCVRHNGDWFLLTETSEVILLRLFILLWIQIRTAPANGINVSFKTKTLQEEVSPNMEHIFNGTCSWSITIFHFLSWISLIVHWNLALQSLSRKVATSSRQEHLVTWTLVNIHHICYCFQRPHPLLRSESCTIVDSTRNRA